MDVNNQCIGKLFEQLSNISIRLMCLSLLLPEICIESLNGFSITNIITLTMVYYSSIYAFVKRPFQILMSAHQLQIYVVTTRTAKIQ